MVAILQEFIYTLGTSLFCFAAWVAQFSDLYGFYDPKYAWRYDAQIAAAVTAVSRIGIVRISE